MHVKFLKIIYFVFKEKLTNFSNEKPTSMFAMVLTKYLFWLMKVVGPKRRSLEEAEATLATQMARLHEKQAELQAITDKLNGLKDQLKTKEEEKVVRQCVDIHLVFLW